MIYYIYIICLWVEACKKRRTAPNLNKWMTISLGEPTNYTSDAKHIQTVLGLVHRLFHNEKQQRMHGKTAVSGKSEMFLYIYIYINDNNDNNENNDNNDTNNDYIYIYDICFNTTQAITAMIR